MVVVKVVVLVLVVGGVEVMMVVEGVEVMLVVEGVEVMMVVEGVEVEGTLVVGVENFDNFHFGVLEIEEVMKKNNLKTEKK